MARGLSAGRVQSVAVKLLVEREREINAFIPEEFWDIHADTTTLNNTDFRLLVAQKLVQPLSQLMKRKPKQHYRYLKKPLTKFVNEKIARPQVSLLPHISPLHCNKRQVLA